MGRSSVPICTVTSAATSVVLNKTNLALETKNTLNMLSQLCNQMPSVRMPQAFGKVPGAIKADGTPILGRFGAKAKGRLTDVLHRDLGELRNSAARERRDIIRNAEGLTNVTQRDNFLKQEYSRISGEVAELKDQLDLYGTNSVQGRTVGNAINRKLNTLSAIEGLKAGTLTAEQGLANRKISKSYTNDYNYTPQDGQFGRRAKQGTLTSVEKARLTEFQANNRAYRSDVYDTLKTIRNQNSSSALARRQEIYSQAQQAVRHYAWQRDLYRGTDWKPALDREIMHNLKIIKEVSRQDSRFKLSSEMLELLPRHLQAQVY